MTDAIDPYNMALALDKYHRYLDAVDPKEKVVITKGGWVPDGDSDVWVNDNEAIADLQAIVEDLS